jgi:ATP-dependent Clp protease ATP-binding subunit ClpC
VVDPVTAASYLRIVFERLSHPARHAIDKAVQEAVVLGASMVGPEHLVLGLLDDPDSFAGRALRSCGLSLENGRRVLREHELSKRSGLLSFSPRMNRALDQSLREAIRLGSRYIGPQHLLLGALGVGDGTVAAVLQSVGTDIGIVRGRLRSILGEPNGWEALVDRAAARIERTFDEAETMGADPLSGTGP